MDVIRSKPYVEDVCAWVHMGSTTASIFEDELGTIRPGATNTKAAIRRAFTAGNAAFGKRGRIV
jgi:hypothetical protein